MNVKERLSIFDNLKFLLIILVVLGHAADFYTSKYSEARWFYLYIYSFHMPAFIFISGFFSKGLLTSKASPANKIISLLLIYFLMQLSFYFLSYFNGVNPKLSLFVVGGVPWFMLALSIWIGVIFIFKDINPTYLLIFSLIAGVLIGFDSSVTQFLATARVIVFFPFFVLGVYFKFDWIASFKLNRIKIICSIFLIFSMVLSWYYIDEIYKYRAIFTGQNPYSYTSFSTSIFSSIKARVIAYFLAGIFLISLLSLIPNKKYWFTKLGERTLSVYVLHHLILNQYHYSAINNKLLSVFPNLWWLVYIVIYIAIIFILSSSMISKPFDFIMSRKFSSIKKQHKCDSCKE